MEIDILWLLMAFAGGAFGAAIGGLNAFVMTGFAFMFGFSALLAGLPEGQDFIGMFAFGPVFGPHISFAGGAAAAAYAAKRGYFAEEGINGRAIEPALAGYAKMDILAVGGIFGMVGYVMNQVFVWLFGLWRPEVAELGLGERQELIWSGDGVLVATDTIALSVVGVAIIARLMFGQKSKALLGPFNGHKPLSLNDGTHWVPWQEKWSASAFIGLISGGLFAWVAIWIIQTIPVDSPAYVNISSQVFLIGWAIGAISLLFLSLGVKVPVTHHMTIIAALAAVQMYAAVGTDAWVAVLVGAVAGLVSGLLGEAFSRLFNARGDTHIDPPAGAIFILTTVVYLVTTL